MDHAPHVRRAAGLLILGTVLCVSAAPAADVGFAVKPQVKTDGGKVVISFSASKPTDVEVAVLDAKGNPVRHLAAGVIGKGTPVAPLKAGLRQELTWDGNNDLGKKATGGPFSVRVRLGLDVKLDGFLGENKHHFGGFWGMATDLKGNVYILGASTGNKGPDGTRYMQVFDRSGKYVKTLMPMPANLSPGELGAFRVILTDDGHIAPRNYRGTWPVLYGGLGRPSMTSRIGEDGVIWFTDGKHVARIKADGTGVGARFARGVWAKKLHRTVNRWLMSWGSRLAVSPDGKTIYLAGLFQKKAFQKQPLAHSPGRIYRAGAEAGHMTPFAELKGKNGKPIHVAGMACDRDGNLFACDPGGSRVVVLSPAGKQIGELPASNARQVAVHRKTGAVYVLGTKTSGTYRATKHLIKLSGWKKGARELARTKLSKEGYKAVMALDDSADPPVVWVGIDRAKAGDAYALRTRAEVLRLEDRGETFAATGHECKFRHLPMGVVTRLAVHPETDVVVCRGEYAHSAAYEGLTGARIKTPFKYAVDMGVGKDGYFYVQTGYTWAGPLCKYDGRLRPVKAPGNRKPPNAVLPRVFGRYGNGFGVAGFTADLKGRLYVAQQLDEQTISGDCVVVFGPEGKAEDPGRMKGHERFKKHGLWKSAIFGPIAGPIGNIHVDRDGYFYLAVRGLPMKHKSPAGFEKDNAYHWVSGCVVKIKPEGGGMFLLGGSFARPPLRERKVPAGMPGARITKRSGYPRGPRFVENAVTVYPGIGSMSGGLGTGCRCRQPMFDLDKWGRLFIPNAITYSVKVVDNQGNLITKFGHYGNADSRGDNEDSPIRTPVVPLGWPEAVGVSRTAVYVADVLNRRIVRLLKTYAATETCSVK